jgi:hypothetical protein
MPMRESRGKLETMCLCQSVLTRISFMLKLIRDLKRTEMENAIIVSCVLGVTVFPLICKIFFSLHDINRISFMNNVTSLFYVYFKIIIGLIIDHY